MLISLILLVIIAIVGFWIIKQMSSPVSTILSILFGLLMLLWLFKLAGISLPF